MVEVDVSKGVEVSSFHYDVKYDGDSTKDMESSHLWGNCSFHQKVISIRECDSAQFRATFLHECLEAINEYYCNRSLKHDEITNIGNGMAQILKSLGITFVKEG